jgi:hypothetical protein
MTPALRAPAHKRGEPATRTNGSVTAAAYTTRGLAVPLPNPPTREPCKTVTECSLSAIEPPETISRHRCIAAPRTVIHSSKETDSLLPYTKRSLPLASKKAKRHHTVGAIRLRCIITSKLTVTNPEKLLLTLRESNERCSLLHLQIQGAVQPGRRVAPDGRRRASWLGSAGHDTALIKWRKHYRRPASALLTDLTQAVWRTAG